MHILLELLDWIASLVTCLLILQSYFHYFRIPMYHALGEWTLKITTPLTQPIRRLIKPQRNLYGVDWIPVVMAFLIYWLWHGLAYRSHFGTFTGYFNFPLPFFISLLNTGLALIYVLFSMMTWMVLLSIAVSWISPQNRGNWLDQAINPWINPIRKKIPPFYGLDFSSVVFLIFLRMSISVVAHVMPFPYFLGLHALISRSPF